MSFNISEFSSKINKHGLAKDNLFLVTITPPSGLNVEMPTGDLRFFCNSVALPALNITSAEVLHQGYGLSEKRPTGLPLDNLNTVFMVDSNFRVKEFFHRWMQSIVNFDTTNYEQEFRGMLPYEVAYKDTYVGTVTVEVYSFNDNAVKYVYTFGNAYPAAMGDITSAWSNNDAVMTVPIQFSYDRYTVDGFGQSSQTSRRNRSPGSLGGGVGGFVTRLSSFGRALDALGIDTPIQEVVNEYTSVASQLAAGVQGVRDLLR